MVGPSSESVFRFFGGLFFVFSLSRGRFAPLSLSLRRKMRRPPSLSCVFFSQLGSAEGKGGMKEEDFADLCDSLTAVGREGTELIRSADWVGAFHITAGAQE
uniref:Uncharacterized protein n=1 Tax=Trieres chinensis TaxID=1514140 RepID=A0A7S2A9Z3_TRICV